ncbi:MAG: arabinan endo-1,5-alpha-L-arabinosidase [Treponema sp.]|nr:arabinan endo-1,5-alpha-L-arabinosidase [Treponema sp.]
MALLNVFGETATHDPVIVKEKDLYYRFQTGRELTFYTSSDLLEWNMAASVFPENPEWTRKKVPLSRKNDYWAPDLVYRKGKWRLYYSVSSFGKNTSAIGMVQSSSLNPASENYGWTDFGEIISSTEKDDYNAIDPQVCSDKEGNDYLLFGSFWKGLQLTALDENGFVKDKSSLVTIASRCLLPNSIEGGYIIRHDDFYYLFASHDFCCRGLDSSYKIIVGQAENICGPYFDRAGKSLLEGGGSILRDGSTYKRWAGPGHNSIFQDDDGKTYIVYHAYDRENRGRPSLQIEELKWKNDWPVFD